MLRCVKGLIIPIILLAAPVCAAAAEAAATHYHISGRIAGPDGRWDYAAVDATARRLYVARQGGLLSTTLGGAPVARITYPYPLIHQPLLIGGDRVILTTGNSNKALVLNGATGQLLAEVATGDGPDAAAFDTSTGLAVTFNHRGQNATVFDVDKALVTGTIKLFETPEFAVSDGKGIVYVNLVESGRIGVIDIAKAKIVRKFKLENCQEPTGLAYDRQTGFLVSACSNGIADVVTTSGQPVASLKIGPKADAAFIDEGRRLAFIPSGGDGTLSVISLADPKNISVVQVLKTRIGARTGAVDTVTGNIYLPVAGLLPPTPPAKWPSVVPGSFEILVVEP